MATTTISGTSVTFSNSGAAADMSGSFTEDSTLITSFDVLAASGGGTKTTLYSVDNGITGDNLTTNPLVTTNKAFATYDTDLLYNDAAVVSWQANGDTSHLGAHVWIGTDNKVHYDASGLSASLQALGAGQFLTDSFEYTIKMSNGTLSVGTITVQLNGVNDAPVIVSHTDGGVTEDVGVIAGNLHKTGAVSFSDVDLPDTHTASVSFVSSTNGTALGSLTLGAVTDTTGTGVGGSVGWTYTADNSQVGIQKLGASDTVTEVFAVTVSDNHGGTTTQNITVTINGTNDVPVIGGTSTGSVKEDVAVVSNAISTSGALTISDADQGQSNFAVQASHAGTYGTFSLDAAGNWTYSADNSQTAIQQLGAGQSISDSFTAVSSDGTASQLVTVTINGTNDVPVIGGTSTGSVKEDVAVVSNAISTSGALTISDADQGQSNFTAHASISGSYGTFSLDAAGNWTYSADNSQTAIQQLGAGQSISDSFTAVSSDGTASQFVTVTINGTNDVPVIGGTSTGSVKEDVAVVSNAISTSGALTISDADQGQSNFTAHASISGAYGTFSLDAAGNWTYSADNSQTAIQQLGAGQSISDSFTAVSSDGTASQLVTVTINGTNDVPVIGGTSTGSVKEDVAVVSNAISTSGALTITDADQGQSNFTAHASISGTYGTFSLDAAGNWTYSTDNSQTAIQQLGAGQSISDSFTAVSSDGTASQLVTVTINGTNDVPVIGGTSTGSVKEDVAVVSNAISTSGALTISDADQGQSNFTAHASISGSYGTFSLDAAGNWTYSADNSQTAIQQLGAGQSISDSFTAVSSDGTASQLVTVTINGTNDVPVIGGTSTGSVKEDVAVVSNAISTSGALTISDADQGQSNFTAHASISGAYGTFSLDAAGNWTYSADNSQTAIQQLGAGQSISDSFTAVSSDGTASQLVTVTINGTNDVPVIGGTSTGSVKEDVAVVSNAISTSGALTISDADQGQSNFTAHASISGSYGTFSLDAAGNWTYSTDNSQTAIQQLGAGQSISDSFTAVSSDGTASQLVTVTINGTNDVPVIGGTSTGSVKEDVAVVSNAISTSGALTISDADQGQSNFTAHASISGAYGTFSLDAAGNWTYSADNSQTAIQQLGAGQSISDSFTAVSSDGTASQLVTVTINGTNDVPVIGGTSTGSVKEDVAVVSNAISTSGALTITDADQGQSNFAVQASHAGTYGTFSLDAAGNWTYSADNSQTAIQQLGAGQSISDSFTAVSSDGTASQLVTVTINGTNDVPVLTGGTVAGTVSEESIIANGTFHYTDADITDGHTATFQQQAGDTAHLPIGGFSVTPVSGGVNWNFTSTAGAYQNIAHGTYLEHFDVTVNDGHGGTAVQTVTITINVGETVAAANDTATANQGQTLTVNAANGLLANDTSSNPSDIIFGPLQINQVNGQSLSGGQVTVTTAHGATVTVHSDGSYTYNSGSYSGSDSFSYTAIDSHGDVSNSATDTITVNSTNQAPTNMIFTPIAQSGNTLTLGTFHATDPDGDTLTYSSSDPTHVVVDPSSGALSINQGSGNPLFSAAAVTISATDPGGLHVDQNYNIWIASGGNTVDTVALATQFNNNGLPTIADGLNGGDIITGTSAVDYIWGGSSDDTITGGGGADQLSGGNGSNAYKYNAVADSAVGAGDTILDFTLGNQHDTIDFSGVEAVTHTLTFHNTTAATFSVWGTQNGADTIISVDTSGDAVADMTILLKGITAANLVSGDFHF